MASFESFCVGSGVLLSGVMSTISHDPPVQASSCVPELVSSSS